MRLFNAKYYIYNYFSKHHGVVNDEKTLKLIIA